MSEEQTKYEEPDFTEEEGKLMDSFWDEEPVEKPELKSEPKKEEK